MLLYTQLSQQMCDYIQLIIDNKIYNCDKFDSIYKLKMKLNSHSYDRIYLTHNGKILENDKTIYSYGINDNDIINMSMQMKGGGNTGILASLFGSARDIGNATGVTSNPKIYWFIIKVLVTIFVFLLFGTIVYSGFLPFLSKAYGLILIGVMRYVVNIDIIIQNLINGKKMLSDLRPYNWFFKILTMVIHIFMLYIFMTVFTTLLFFTMNIVLQRAGCDSLSMAGKASNPIRWVFLFFFILLEIPKTFLNIIETDKKYIGHILPIQNISTFIDVCLMSLRDGLISWYLTIPFIGNYFTTVYNTLNYLFSTSQKFSNLKIKDCNDINDKNKLLYELRRINRPEYIEDIKIRKYISKITKGVENSDFLGNLFCTIFLKNSDNLNYFYNEQGGISNILMSIQNGSIAGIITTPVLLLTIILNFIGYIKA